MSSRKRSVSNSPAQGSTPPPINEAVTLEEFPQEHRQTHRVAKSNRIPSVGRGSSGRPNLSPTMLASAHPGEGQGGSKRQAKGVFTSPKPYIRGGNTSRTDGSLTSDNAMDYSVTPPSAIGSGDHPMLPAVNATDNPYSEHFRPSSTAFPTPKFPQSARHQNVPGAVPPLQSPQQNRNGGSGSGSGSGGNSNNGGHAHSVSSNPGRLQSSSSLQSRFNKYSDGPYHRSTHSFAMMDLDESLRAIYFAPVPLIVLDSNRNIKMLNRPAELVLGIGGASCAGQRMERYVAQACRASFTLSLNEASENFSKTSSGLATPVHTRVMFQPLRGNSSTWAELSIAAWFPTDTLFSAETERGHTGRESSETSSNPASSPSTQDTSTRSNVSLPSAQNAPPPHEALFTISIVPSSSNLDVNNTIKENVSSKATELIQENIMHHLNTAVLASSKDGKTAIANKACDEVLSVFGRKVRPADDSRKDEEGTNVDADFSWIHDVMDCFDENFEKPFLESDWPIYKCSVLGQVAPAVIMGIQSKATGERMFLEISGRPMRDRNGYGEHIGGIITIRNITAERTRLREEARQQGDLYFKQTCDAMPQLVWVTSPTGYHEWFSNSWYEYTGSSSYECQGVGWQGYFHEEDTPEAGRRWSHSLRTGELYETAYRCKRYDGVWRWFLGRALPMKDELGNIKKWFGTCTDIHDQVEALSASRRAQSQLESVINHAAMTLWAVDRDGRITVAEGPGVRQLKLAGPGTPVSERDQIGGFPIGTSSGSNANANNNTAASLHSDHGSEHQYSTNASHTSATKRNMIGRSIYSVWDSTNIRDSMEKALKGETVVEEMEVDGRWFRTSYTPLRALSTAVDEFMESSEKEDDNSRHGDDDDDIKGESSEEGGEIIGVVGASMDITDRKRAQESMEESLLEKTRALAAEGAAREASRLKSEFLANMSHEIRTPIAGVIGLSELLLDEKGLTAQHRDYAETIQRSAEGLLTVINDVLDFSKVEIGKLEVEQAPFKLEVVLRDAKRMLSFATQKKDLDFRDSVQLDYKGQLIGDVGRLRQVITNLLTNAIKFTAKGYISLEVAELSEDETNIMIRFDVRDTGCGISSQALSRLFQPFSQADPSTARRFGGTGLGLSISKNLVELMNGEIGLNSVEGQGSHAWFVIPFCKAGLVEEDHGMTETVHTPAMTASDQGASDTSDGGDRSGGDGSGEKNEIPRSRGDIWILVAEDNAVNAQIASKNIKRMGFNCRIAENGLKALEELNKNTYDAVLMDCQMPECDGYEATKMIRQSTNFTIRTLPVIALTASAIKGDRERAIDAGMIDYLAKPVKRPALEATLCKWLFDQEARSGVAKTFSKIPKSPKNSSVYHYNHSHHQNYYDTAPSSIGMDRFQSASSSSTIKWNEAVHVQGEKETVSLDLDDRKSYPAMSVALHDGGGGGGGGGGSDDDNDELLSLTQASTPKAKAKKQATSGSRLNDAVLEKLRTPPSTASSSRQQLESLFYKNGDALSAAASLISARRSSAEDMSKMRIPSQTSLRGSRPPLSPRSFSHGAPTLSPSSLSLAPSPSILPTPSFSSSAFPLTATTTTPASGRSAIEGKSDTHRSDMTRKSSRGQAGLGRDLNGEIFRATYTKES
ncbi:hypothetical protein CBS101457_001465 [Exobasidium rhododendri]|nr:hypothetical protein CBS101457_001465 [Exobasidium rhododendri]